ncbi:hypothetical protein HNQ80_001952 [Anaerosolibacter carboniphilus]|uniref:Group II intron, maturase-specific domain n=1 Tax=Anaerosolibacter carboniphilus TaxID=1417629 RepID=A0A841KR79_9FIRM|nr:group II intron maturase-specific domain-containing protein [Anaerosolibacter carboniphilus]MBB6215861.1 hypothetical protein [Anaerosolibacter carboniphilus]
MKRCKAWLRDDLTTSTVEIMKKLAVKLKGYYRYYGVTDNSIMMGKFLDEVRSILYKALNRKSQKKGFNWDKYVLFLKKYPPARPKTTVNIYELRPEISYIM